MKEHPILYSGPMILALLGDRKTKTRRVMKPQPTYDGLPVKKISPLREGIDNHLTGEFMLHHPEYERVVRSGYWCPYGAPGDRLWVRESFYVQPELWAESHGLQPIAYAADVQHRDQVEDYIQKPSIHMPRWASRITLEVVNVRAERLQDITEEDAGAEGICTSVVNPSPVGLGHKGFRAKNYVYAREAFRDLWKIINGAESWDADPWVWVIEFKRVDGGAR